MRLFVGLFVGALLPFSLLAQAPSKRPIAIAIHGGAGTILKSQMTPEKEKAYQQALTEALNAGYVILEKGGSSMDAVEAAVMILENSPLFNAGKGAVFTNAGKNELDAAIMNGKTLEAGAVASVTTVKNPIRLARRVMEKSGHVMMIGSGAEAYAKQEGIELVDPSYFYTQERWDALQKIKAEDSTKVALDHNDKKTVQLLKQPGNRDYKYGTVGAVALDREGNLAAATSTGGMTNKKFGRVGDAPIIGAGTYANNQTAAISCTGWGEYFIRAVVAKTISDLMKYQKMSIEKATAIALQEMASLGGDGGLIAVDKQGNIALPFNTEGMYRASKKEGKPAYIAIYK